MNKKTKQWLAGCGIGCGAILILGLIGSVVGTMFLMGGFKDSIATREILDERHGDQGDFIPAMNGAISTESMEKFLTVRSAIMEHCEEFTTTMQKFESMEDMGDDTSKKEAFSGVMNLTGDIFMMVPRMGRFYGARNGTLLDVDMGLGEYTYIYVLAYGYHLRGEGRAARGDAFNSGEPNDRVCKALRQMLRNQLNTVVDPDERAMLEQEIGRLEADPESIPWVGELPSAIAASLDPYRQQLEDLFCPATIFLEFNKNRTQGLSIHGE